MSDFFARYQQLNPAQRQAVDTLEGPVMVVAGPGTGKTELLGVRIANILRTTDAPASSILCLTFTESAASSMRERLVGLLGADAYKVAIHTFHGFAGAILQQYPELSPIGGSLPADELTQYSFIDAALTKLPGTSDLRSKRGDESYVYTRAIRDSIAHIKQAGYTSEQFTEFLLSYSEEITQCNQKIAPVLGERITKSTAQKLSEALVSLPITQCSTQLQAELAPCILEAEEGSTKALSAWKTANMRKAEDGTSQLKWFTNLGKLLDFGVVYQHYQHSLTHANRADFSDLILHALGALETHEHLRGELQERYLYVHVDEFQDTNPAQLRLLQHITDHPIHEGRPNVLVVGDDDQAIYRFQGAEIENILNFRTLFRDPLVLVLTQTYRSRQDILEVARHVIEQAAVRLTTLYPDISKPLHSIHQQPAVVARLSFSSQLEEQVDIVARINQQVAAGTPTSDIAIICRTHRELSSFAQLLLEQHIQVQYDRQQNVLELPAVQQLLRLSQLCLAVANGATKTASALLPELFSYPFLGIDRPTVWQLAGAHPEDWLQAAAISPNAALSAFASWTQEVSGLISTSTAQDWLAHILHDSPYASALSGPELRATNPQQVVQLASALHCLLTAAHEHYGSELVTTEKLLQFVALTERAGERITNTVHFGSTTNGVALLTAHRAKGMEFGTVYLPGCTHQTWIDSRTSSTSLLPYTLKGLVPSDEPDDAIRLLYVALTRAKHSLVISYHQHDVLGRVRTPAFYISGDTPALPAEQTVSVAAEQTGAAILTTWHHTYFPSQQNEQEVLLQLLERTKLSATSIITFFDLERGGPEQFIRRYLLRLPEAGSDASSYGTAVHSAVRWYWNTAQQSGRPSLQQFLERFTDSLRLVPMPEVDRRALLERGHSDLQRYYQAKGSESRPGERLEYRPGSSFLGDIPLSGSVDRLTIHPDHLVVSDLKTSLHVSTSWERGDAAERIRLWRYQRQLQFYALLVQQGGEFGRRQVTQGTIEFLAKPEASSDLTRSISSEEVAYLANLTKSLWLRLHALDLSVDPEQFPATAEGILKFERDTLERYPTPHE